MLVALSDVEQVIHTVFLEEDVSAYTDIHQSQVDILQAIMTSDGEQLEVSKL